MRLDRLVEKGRIYLDPTLPEEVDCTVRLAKADVSTMLLQELVQLVNHLIVRREKARAKLA
jgi:hypothetical protein